MNINFNEVTYEKLKFLATSEGKSVAAYVAQLMDEYTGQMVNVSFTMNTVPEGVEIIPRTRQEAMIETLSKAYSEKY
ncbi:hypothetical protein [Salmonella phage SSBI34]|nr:hypothetical protein [Salmonella phage SSBI34]